MNLWERFKWCWFLFCLKFKKGLNFGSGLVIINKPIIDIRDNAKITIGQNVTLNSRNLGYHFNMHSPVKLYANVNDQAYIKIGDNTRINGACLHAKAGIEVGKNCLIAANVQIFDCNSHLLMLDTPELRKDSKAIPKPIKIHDNVWICANAIILPGVTIGEGSVIAAGSVVTKDVPARSVVGGNPARLIQIKSGNEPDNSGLIDF